LKLEAKKRLKKFMHRSFALIVALTVFVAALFSVAGASYTARSAGDITRYVAETVEARRTSVDIDYNFSISSLALRRAIENGLSATIENMAAVLNHSYTTRGTRLTVVINYDRFASGVISYADSDADIVAAIARSVNLKEDELVIYYPDKNNLYNTSTMLAKCGSLYQQYLDESWDEYNVYSLDVVGRAVKPVDAENSGFFLKYSFFYKETLDERETVKAFVKETIKSLGLDGLTSAEKVREINTFVINYAQYSLSDDVKIYTAYGFMANKKAVCQGYTLFTYLMLEEAGVPSSLVRGSVLGTGNPQDSNHIWNIVNIDGDWLHLDTTFNRASISGGMGEKYFLLSPDDEALKNHRWDETSFNDGAYAAKTYRRQRSKDMTVVLKIDDPYMLVGDAVAEVDPGRATTPIITPIILRDRTFLPLRAVIEEFGGSVFWMSRERQVIVNYKDFAIDTWIGSDRAMINGYAFKMDASPVINNDRTMVPVRFIAEKLGLGVVWDAKERTVTIIPYRI